MNILLIEDSQDIVDGLKFLLEEYDYNVEYRKNVNGAKGYLNKNIPDLIVLDVSLSDGNGFDLYKNNIMEKKIPTIFLTARDDENDIVKGLELGADDYLTKPFSTKELMARIKKILLRNKRDTVISFKNITFDVENMIVKKDEKLIEFTALELKILDLLFINKGNLVRRSILLDKIWEWTGNDVEDHTVTVYMKRIKDKLGDNIIITVKGLGYKLDDEK